MKTQMDKPLAPVAQEICIGEAMKNLFIDSNIWLSLYHFTSDDLNQFKKLKDYLGSEINLLVPQQVYDEILRNRERKLMGSLKEFQMKALQYPAFCKGYAEYECFSEEYSKLKDQFEAWEMKIYNDIQENKLPADLTIKEIFASVELLACDGVIDRAFTRCRIGNPPGKDNSNGDSINWECLLHYVPEGEDIYIISADRDYCSILFKNSFNPFLTDEWERTKHSKVFFFKNLVSFLNEHVKGIQLKTEKEKQELITALANSHNFLTTHGIIAELNRHTGWTSAQIEELCLTANSNTQVSWIMSDEDVYTFYLNLISDIDAIPDNSAISSISEQLQNIAASKQESYRLDVKEEMADALDEFINH